MSWFTRESKWEREEVEMLRHLNNTWDTLPVHIEDLELALGRELGDEHYLFLKSISGDKWDVDVPWHLLPEDFHPTDEGWDRIKDVLIERQMRIGGFSY